MSGYDTIKKCLQQSIFTEYEKVWKHKNRIKRLANLVNIAISRIFCMVLTQSGFSCTGMFPLNQNIYSSLEFPASLSDENEISFTKQTL